MKKSEQLFVLGIGCIGMLGLLCVSGCSGCSVELPQCGGINEDGIQAVGVSVPGCGVEGVMAICVGMELWASRT